MRIGAATPIAAFEEDLLLRRQAPVLARCSVWFAAEHIRQQATVGGNLVRAGGCTCLFSPSLKTATLASEAIRAGWWAHELAIASTERPFSGVRASGMAARAAPRHRGLSEAEVHQDRTGISHAEQGAMQ